MQATDEQELKTNPSVITYCLKVINPNNTGGEFIINDLPTKGVYSSSRLSCMRSPNSTQKDMIQCSALLLLVTVSKESRRR